jgi:nucleotide-binding universal stress UspA family protein
MKTILVPTDFSEAAANATDYAATLASYCNASLILFHAYHVPVTVSEVPFTTTLEDIQLEETARAQLELVRTNIKSKYQNKINVELLLSPGLLADEFPSVVDTTKSDLIVISTHSLDANRRFWGGSTQRVIKNASCDVLVVPDTIKFQKIDKIVLAFDYYTVKNITTYKTLIEIAEVFASQVLIFNIEDSRIHPPKEKESQGIQLECLLTNINHTYWFSETQDIVEALNHFTEDTQAVMVAMIRREHSLFRSLFEKSNTKRMALRTHFPLLILHEKNDF